MKMFLFFLFQFLTHFERNRQPWNSFRIHRRKNNFETIIFCESRSVLVDGGVPVEPVVADSELRHEALVQHVHRPRDHHDLRAPRLVDVHEIDLRVGDKVENAAVLADGGVFQVRRVSRVGSDHLRNLRDVRDRGNHVEARRALEDREERRGVVLDGKGELRRRRPRILKCEVVGFF